MKPLTEISSTLPSKTLTFSLINKMKTSPQLSNTLKILIKIKMYTMYKQNRQIERI